MHILIVEDEALVAADLKRILRKRNPNDSVAIAADEAEALQQIAAQVPDLIFMDIKLRGGADGVVTALNIQQQYDAPVIYITGHSDRNTIERIKITQPQGYLIKPVEANELLTVMEIALMRHSTEKQVRRAEQQYRKLINTTADGFCALNLAGRITDVNEAYCRMTGYTRDELLERHISALEADDSFEEIQQRIALLMSLGFDRFETRHRSKDGRLIDIEASISYVPQQSALLAFLRDISARKASERQILHLNHVLQRRADEIQALYEAEHEHRALAETLVQTSQSMTMTLDVNLVLDRILEQIGRVVKNDVCNIMLIDGDNTHTVRSRGYETFDASEFIEGFVFPLSGLPVRQQIIESGEPVVVSDVRTDSKWPLPAGAAWLRSYVAAPILLQNEVIGFINIGTSQPGFYHDNHARRLQAFGHQAAIAFQNARLFEEAQRTTAQLQVLSRRLLEVQETERRYIARELHDEVGQALTAAKINLQALQQQDSPALQQAKLEKATQIINLALQQVRDLSLNLHPAILDDLGLLPALRWYTDRESQWGDIYAQVLSCELPRRLSPEIELVCFRVAQEALTNVVRHAGAKNAAIEIWQRNNELHMVIRDDGIGFDPQEVFAKVMKSTSLGILGMQERVMLAGGTIEINSSPGNGAEIHLRLPIHYYEEPRRVNPEVGS